MHCTLWSDLFIGYLDVTPNSSNRISPNASSSRFTQNVSNRYSPNTSSSKYGSKYAFSLCLNFVHLLALKPNLEKKIILLKQSLS